MDDDDYYPPESILARVKLLMKYEKKPDQVIIFTDMNFDQADENSKDINTTYEIIKNIYNEKIPKLIFWNINSKTSKTLPIETNTEDTIIINGYSQHLLEMLINSDNISQYGFLDNILEKYDDIELA